MFGAKQPVSLVKIFKRTQLRVTLLAVLSCSGLFTLISLSILQSLIQHQAQQQLIYIQTAFEKNLKQTDPNQFYQQYTAAALDNGSALRIEVRSTDDLTQHVFQPVLPISKFEHYLNQFFFQQPLQLEFKNNVEQGLLVFYIRTYPFLSHYAAVFLSIIGMLFFLPLLVMFFFYHTHRFLNRNISPLVQAIHQFNRAEYSYKKRDYSYIKEIQFFSTTFNTLVNKFESTKQNLAEQNLLLDWQANHDVLTQLPNRQYFQKYLLKEFNHNQHSNMVVLFIDNNKFKAINDTYGHQAGDAVLMETAQRLKANLTQDDFIARLGGDEFAAVLRRVENYQDLVDVCEKLRFCCHEPLIFESNTIPFSFSIGASYAYHASNIEELLHHADLAMYKAKLSEKKWHIYKREAAFSYTDY